MQSTGLTSLPTRHNRMLVTGALFAAVGGLLGFIGALIGGAAITATLREWARSESSQQLLTAARAAANAAAKSGATAWRTSVPQQGTGSSTTTSGV